MKKIILFCLLCVLTFGSTVASAQHRHHRMHHRMHHRAHHPHHMQHHHR